MFTILHTPLQSPVTTEGRAPPRPQSGNYTQKSGRENELRGNFLKTQLVMMKNIYQMLYLTSTTLFPPPQTVQKEGDTQYCII